MTPKPLLLLAVGNESRGDDALGPFLARRVQAWLASTGLDSQVEVIEEYQLQIEHTLDIMDRQLLLFVDAGQETMTPYTFYAARAARLDGHTSHALAPETLLGVYAQVHQASPPPAFILCLAGTGFDLGEPLSAAASLHLEQGFAFCRGLFEQPTPDFWSEQARMHHPS